MVSLLHKISVNNPTIFKKFKNNREGTSVEKHYRNIKNEMAYFYTVIKNMNIRDNIKNSKVKEYEISLEEVLYDNFLDNFDMDKQFLEQNSLDWIELIENENLYRAIKNLSSEDQIFMSYIVKECLTQRELSKIYKVNHRTIGRKFERILNKIKKFL